jgi:hypothetical protein
VSRASSDQPTAERLSVRMCVGNAAKCFRLATSLAYEADEGTVLVRSRRQVIHSRRRNGESFPVSPHAKVLDVAHRSPLEVECYEPQPRTGANSRKRLETGNAWTLNISVDKRTRNAESDMRVRQIRRRLQVTPFTTVDGKVTTPVRGELENP